MDALTAFLRADAARAFVWGVRDCGLRLADWVLVARDLDPADDVRGTYTNPEELAVIMGWGGLPRFVARLARRAGLSRTDTPARGDIAVVVLSAALTEDWIPSANICDESIALKAGGTEPRYRCAGGYPLPSAPKDVLPSIMATCQGQVFMRSDGAIGIRVGKVVAPSLVYGADEKHITAYSGFRTGDDLFLVANEITAKFTGPDYDYQDTDVTPWRNEADVTARGQVLTSDLNLSWVPSYSQARRLMKIEYYRKNPSWVGQFNFDLYVLNGFGERYLRLTLSDLEIANLDCEITSFGIDPASGTCPIGISAFNAAAYEWDPATEEGDPRRRSPI